MRKNPQPPARRPTPLEEWAIVTDRVTRDPEGFIKFLNSHLKRKGDCRLWQSNSVTQYGYASVALWYDGQQFLVYVHRLFLTLMLRHPIPKGYHAGHDHSVCPHSNCVFHLFLEEASANSREVMIRLNAKLKKARPAVA